mgnify:CR=1 FL=1
MYDRSNGFINSILPKTACACGTKSSTLNGRTGTIEPVHQHSHKKKYTRDSVGNATADLMADVFTLEGGQGRISNTTELPVRLAEKQFYFKDQSTKTMLTEAVRQKMKLDQQMRADKRWKGRGCQNRIKNQIVEFLPYITRRKQEKQNKGTKERNGTHKK